MTDTDLLATIRAAQAKATKGRIRAEGTIYDGFEACLARNGRTIAHVADHHDAAMLAALANNRDRLLELADAGLKIGAAAEALLTKLDAAKPHVDSAVEIATIHHCPYRGPTYGEEAEALRAALVTTPEDAG